jgi:microcystin-dependent protein
MAVPLPVDIVAGALPLGFKGNAQEILYAFVDAISATVDPTFLTGLVGGTVPPSSDIGPWATAGNEWWFWDPVSGQYQPTNQGAPIGTVIMFGGAGVPNNWLLCDGRAVARTLYSRLFQAIGETFGAGDSQSTFNLPPPAKFFVNAPGFAASDPSIPIDAGSTNQGVAARGGSQTFTITGNSLPALVALVKATDTQVNQSGTTNTIRLPTQGGLQAFVEYIYAGFGGPQTGTNQAPIAILPPFCAINHVIKYQ